VDGRVKPGHDEKEKKRTRKRNLEARARQNNPTGKFPLNPSGKSVI
jgi:hypothetical protein